MGLHIFGILGVRKFYPVVILDIKKMRRFEVNKLLGKSKIVSVYSV